jgi:DNA-binding response OmpR family regulator
METETAGWKVVQAARAQEYRPATAILTAYPPPDSNWQERGAHSLLVKPIGTGDLVRQIEALLVSHEDEKQSQRLDPSRPSARADFPPSSKKSRKVG